MRFRGPEGEHYGANTEDEAGARTAIARLHRVDPDSLTRIAEANTETAARLEELRAALRAENISYGELAELQGLADQIEPGDVELLEAAGVPEFPEEG